MENSDRDANITRDDRIMRLPHPIRCGAAMEGAVPPWEKVMGPYTWSEMAKAFAVQGRLTPECLDILMADPRNQVISDFTRMAAYSEESAGTEMGSAFSTFIYMRQVLSPQPHFVIEDALLEMLENTDISDEIPVSMLKPPYQRCFIEFGRSRTVKERVPNIATGLHILEGAYIETGVSSAHGPGIYVMFTGSPLGKDNALDDATDSLFLPTRDEEMPIREALAWAHAQSRELTRELHLRSAPPEYAEQTFSCLKLLVKVLLYLGLPEVRTTLHKDRSEFRKQLEAKKNPSKRAKAEKQLRMLSDYILVSAPPARTEGGSHGTPGSGVKTHWRRGHYRLQPHGPQHSLRKVIFLQPVLVGGSSGTPDTAPKYSVR